MIRPIRRLAAPLVGSLLVCAVFLATAASAIAPYSTTLVMSSKFPAFHGTIQSPFKACTVDRPVLLFLDRLGKPDKRLGGVRSSQTGTWKLDISKTLGSGAYYSKAPYFGSVDAGFTCKADKSRIVAVD